jgi:translation elongation factor EF-G
MARTLNGLAEPDDPNQVPGDLNVLVTVPEEFVGLSIQELNAREGRIVGIERRGENISINATLPTSLYSALLEAIIAGTDGRGQIELIG